MSVRIHALAKEVEMTSKELIDFINSHKDSYGLDIKSASSTIAEIYADAIKVDLRRSEEAIGRVEEENKEEEPKKIVKTAEEVAKEKEDKAISEEKGSEERVISVDKAISEVVVEAEVEKKVEEKKVEENSLKKPNALPRIPFLPKKVISAPNLKGSVENNFSPEKKIVVSKEVVGAENLEKADEVKQGVSGVIPNVGKMAPPMFRLPPRSISTPSIVGVSKVEGEKEEVEDGVKKVLQIKPPIIVKDFAKMLDMKSFKLISELMDMGIFASMNQTIEPEVAIKVATKYGFELDIKYRGEQAQQQQQQKEKEAQKKAEEEDIKNLESRPPIVCILGHVDHGKTTLLDTIRSSNVVAGEAGGITQHTAAYQVEKQGRKITFLDTPGHAAFSKMRERGANVTDVAILVVAADDGFMPQTEEALTFAQKAGVPVVVAINKMDAKGANIDRVKQQMQKKGIAPEEWGGETLCCAVSGLKGTNIDQLLELILLQAEMMDLKANPKRAAEGVVIEAQIEQGRGATSTVIVRKGTLKVGDVIVSKGNMCKVRALLDDKGKKIDSALPSTPVIVMGWTGTPVAGDEFVKVESEKVARQMVEEYEVEVKAAAQVVSTPKATSIEELMAAIANKDKKVLKCVVKSDVSGTVEALVACLEGIKSDKVDLEIIGSGVGQIGKKDVDFASTVGACIVGFNVKQENGVSSVAKHKGIDIIIHNIIYELITQVKDRMKNLLDPELKENKLGMAEVRAVFNVSKSGLAAGCMVTEGMLKRDKLVRVHRGGKEVMKGRIGDLKRFKEDVSEVRAGYECGAVVNGFSDYKVGDLLECYEILEIRPDL